MLLCPFQSLKFDSISIQHVVYKFQVVGMIYWPLLELPVSWWWTSQLSWIWLIPSQKPFDVWRINLYFFEEESIGKYKRIGSWMLKEIAIGSHSTIVGSLSLCLFIYWKFCFAQAYLRLFLSQSSVFYSGKDLNWFPPSSIHTNEDHAQQQSDYLAPSSSGSQGSWMVRETLSIRFITIYKPT